MTPQELARSLRWTFYRLTDPIRNVFAKALRQKCQQRKRWIGADPHKSSADSAIYVHYDAAGDIDDYVIYQLRELVASNYRITFVSNSPDMTDDMIRKVLPYCRVAIWRYNNGYDFGAYKDGILDIESPSTLRSLLIMNDSTYGPFWPLSETLSRADRLEIDYWGIVDSCQQAPHIQSFFVVFFAATLRASAFWSFWRQLPYVNDKGWIIRNAEVRLSQILEGASLRRGVLARYSSVASTAAEKSRHKNPESWGDRGSSRLLATDSVGRSFNPMHQFWNTLVVDYKCPFIKRDLLRTMRGDCSSLARCLEIINSVSKYEVELIRRHLEKR